MPSFPPVKFYGVRTWFNSQFLQKSSRRFIILFAFFTGVFLQTMLNPDGAFVSAFESSNMVLLSLFVAVYCVVCTIIWFYLKRLDTKTATV